MTRLSILLVTLPFFLLAACSDDDSDGGAGTALMPATATAEAPANGVSPPSAGVIAGTVSVDFTGAPEELEPIEAGFEVEEGTTAWEAVIAALGEDEVSFQDFGGDLGIFITGFSGVDAQGNNFWEFGVNGESSEAGVSQYEVQAGDVLEFVYSSF